MKRILCAGLGLTVSAMAALAAGAPTNNVTATIELCSASIKTNLRASAQLQVSCAYSVKASAPKVANPVLLVTVCFETTNSARFHTRVYAYGTDTKLSYFGAVIEKFSKGEKPIDASLVGKVRIDDACSGLGVAKNDKILAVRAELWCDGIMLANYSPQQEADLTKANLPKDWYIRGKYPDKMTYY